MWIVEVNVAGHRFTHRVHASLGSVLHFSPRTLRRRHPQPGQPRVA